MFKFRHTTIKHKLILITMITCTVALISATVPFIVYSHLNFRRHIVQDILMHAEITADNCRSALSLKDVKQTEETLRTLQARPSIVLGRIYTDSGRLFADYYRDGSDSTVPVCEFQQDGHRFSDGFLTVFKGIILDGERVGTVCLMSDLHALDAKLRYDTSIIIAVIVLASSTAYLVSSRLQRIISGPILSLADVAKVVSEKKDYSTRALSHSNDEVGLLIAAFNEMLEQIQQRDLVLIETNEQLEARVRERTSKLTEVNKHLLREIVERRRAEEGVEKAMQQAESANKAKSGFLASMSHEIRTPMNAIMGFSEMLTEQDLTDVQQDYVNIIWDSARYLLQLINDILDLSKIEAGKFDIEIIDCSLKELFDNIESLMRPATKEKEIEFKVLPDAGLPAHIRTDPGRLRQCLVNLIDNAIKFTEKGHVYVSASLQNVDAEGGGGPCIRFDVEDTGIGIAADKQKVIFEPFTQAEGNTTRRFGGTGLGLAITQQLANRLGGGLSLTSEKGKGSVFSLTIPVQLDVKGQPDAVEYDAPIELTGRRSGSEQCRFSGRALVAEDSPTNQMLIRLLLEKMGFEVTIVEDGKEAVEAAMSQPFDLIVMDMQMPNMNGYEATIELRNRATTTPIIALTANAMKGDAQKCIYMGCDAYLPKPLDRTKLVETIRKYLPSEPPRPGEETGSVVFQPKDLRRRVSDDVAQNPELLCSQNGEKVIDWADLTSRCNDEEIIKELTEVFFVENPGYIKTLVEAVNNGNIAQVKSCAHTLKGSAAAIGARTFSKTAHQLELAAGNQDTQMINTVLEHLHREFERLKAFLSRPDWIETAKQQNDQQPEQLKSKQEND